MLAVAGLLEAAWSYAMKRSDGLTRLWPSLAAPAAAGLSFALPSYAPRSLPLGTAYAAWTGIGAPGAFALGVAALGEPASALRVGSVAPILRGTVGPKLASGGWSAAAQAADATPSTRSAAAAPRGGALMR